MGVKIAIIGTGYVGLVSGACFAELGHDVVCVDKDREKIGRIAEGVLPISEPGLGQIVERNVAAGRLAFSTDTRAAVAGREAVFIAVGTPPEPGTGHADLRHVFEAAGEVAGAIDRFTVIVTKSTVPVGTNLKVCAHVIEEGGDRALFAVASNPEFLREGAAVQDFMQPDRVVIGCEDKRALDMMKRIYAPLTANGVPLVTTDIGTAEMIKYAANAFLATKVSFINEIADLCETVGANVADVATGIGLDRRIGHAFLRPGPGWGGSCFPKDTRALLMTAREIGMPARIVEAAVEANETRMRSMVERIRQACGGSVSGRRIAVLGLTFKGQTDDLRESPSLHILPPLLKEGAEIAAFDPARPAEAARLLPGVALAGSGGEVARNSDLLVVMTDWIAFASLDLAAIAAAMRAPVMLDLRNLFTPEEARAAGFTSYARLGHGADAGSPCVHAGAQRTV